MTQARDMSAAPLAHQPPAIEVMGLTRRFGKAIAVDAVTFSIAPAEIFGIIGPNGAGKSTLIKMLTTLLPPTSGTALIAGYDLRTQAAQVRAHIGYVPQLPSADGSLTGYENMLLSARLYDIPRHERRQRIARALARMGLSDAASMLASHYSGGMVRRLEIAQNLLHRPQVLFLDEPTVGLDPAARDAVWTHVLDLRDRFQRTMIVSSHHLEEIEAFCTRVALIDRGRIVCIGTPAELKAGLGPGATLDDVFIQLVSRQGAGMSAARQERPHG